MEVNSNSNQQVTYDANGNKRVQEKTTSNSTFANDLNKAQKESDSVTTRLVEDINSLFKTGLTVDEFERMQELLEEIKKKVNDFTIKFENHNPVNI